MAKCKALTGSAFKGLKCEMTPWVASIPDTECQSALCSAISPQHSYKRGGRFCGKSGGHGLPSVPCQEVWPPLTPRIKCVFSASVHKYASDNTGNVIIGGLCVTRNWWYFGPHLDDRPPRCSQTANAKTRTGYNYKQLECGGKNESRCIERENPSFTCLYVYMFLWGL